MALQVKILREPKPEPIKPRIQCSALMDRSGMKHWRPGYVAEFMARVKERGWNKNQCMHDATHLIDGKYYCSNHGGALALKSLIEEE